jgi:hypothetical protein
MLGPGSLINEARAQSGKKLTKAQATTVIGDANDPPLRSDHREPLDLGSRVRSCPSRRHALEVSASRPEAFRGIPSLPTRPAGTPRTVADANSHSHPNVLRPVDVEPRPRLGALADQLNTWRHGQDC